MAFFSAVCWGSVVVLNKKVLDYINPVPVNFIVLSASTVCLVAIAVPLSLLHLWPLGFDMSWRAAGYIVAGSFVTWVIAFNAFYFALRSGRAGVVGPITGTDPLFTALFAVLIVGTALGHLTVAGLLVATAGVVLISRQTHDEAEAHAPVLEVAAGPAVQESALLVVTLAVVTAAGWGFSPVMIQLAENEVGGASTTMIVLGEAFGVLLLGPFLLLRRPPVFTRRLHQGELRRVCWLVGVTAVLNALFAVIYYVLIEHIGPVLTTVIVATSPIFTILGGVIFLKERFGRWLALGAAVTLAGVIIAILQPVLG